MDEFDYAHLLRWAEQTLHEDEREAVVLRILRYVEEYPELLADRSWPEIRALAEADTTACG